MDSSSEFTQALNLFLKAAQGLIDKNHSDNNFTFDADHLEVDPNGQKFVRIVRCNKTSRSAYCFVEKSTGNVLKPAGWKSPAKGVRSNIYNADHGKSGVTPWGAAYLR